MTTAARRLHSSASGLPRVGDLTTRVLISIRDGIETLAERLESGFAGVNERLDQTNLRLDQTNDRLDQTNDRLDQTIARLDNLRDIAGEKYRELDARIRVLEARLLP
jgi:cell division protein FtsB